MKDTVGELQVLCAKHPKMLRKSGLCVALVVTEAASLKGLPLVPADLRTEEGGQVAGLGKAAVQRILKSHGIERVLAEEGGRTSRGTLLLMQAYVGCLNGLHAHGGADLAIAMAWWIEKVRLHFASDGPKFHFDSSKSLKANIEDLLQQARELQSNSGGTAYVGAMLQHLVGAKLDVVLGIGRVTHHGFSVADHSTDRNGDFHVDKVALHVTTHPTEALVRKCELNLKTGWKPVIVTMDEGVAGAFFLLKNGGIDDRVDVLDISQFLTANLYERSFFVTAAYEATLSALLSRYNEIVSACESDPVLKIRMG